MVELWKKRKGQIIDNCFFKNMNKGSRKKKKSSSTSGRATKALPPTPPRA